MRSTLLSGGWSREGRDVQIHRQQAPENVDSRYTPLHACKLHLRVHTTAPVTAGYQHSMESMNKKDTRENLKVKGTRGCARLIYVQRTGLPQPHAPEKILLRFCAVRQKSSKLAAAEPPASSDHLRRCSYIRVRLHAPPTTLPACPAPAL